MNWESSLQWIRLSNKKAGEQQQRERVVQLGMEVAEQGSVQGAHL